MTAFDNIKVNNWPATSNDLEDFLVLELPLNDQAALTSSRRDIVAGSKVLFPKRTLTNSGVSMVAAAAGGSSTINIAASEYSTTGSVTNPGNLFDGDTSTTVSSSDGSRIYWTPASNISVTKFEVYFDSQYGGYKIGVEVTGGSNQIITKSNPGNSPGWVEFTSIAGDTIGPSNQIKFRSYRSNDTDPGILGINAVRVNDKIVTTAAQVPPKNHYDNNAVFTAGGSGTVITYDADTREALKFGTGDFTVEAWVKKEFTNATSGSSACILEIGDHFDADGVIFMASEFSTKAYSSSGYGSGGALTLGQWHHVAWSRTNGTLKIFRDGQQQSSVSYTNNLTDTQYATTGKSSRTTSVSYHFNGSIQDLRVYKGVGKYTSNFTPPSAILS